MEFNKTIAEAVGLKYNGLGKEELPIHFDIIFVADRYNSE